MSTKSAALSSRDLGLIKNYIVGGAAVGGSAALATSLLNYINTLRRESNTTNKDDDTLYLNMRRPSQPKMASIGGGLALAGGVLGGMGSYAAVRHLYQQMKRQRMQRMLDEAQQGYVDVLDQERKVKQAAAGGKPMGLTELLTSMPVALPLLLALGSGALANRTLSQAFPARSTGRQPTTPRRVVIRDDPQADPQTEEEPDPTKVASVDDGYEFLLRLLTAPEKQAAWDTLDVVHALGQGRAAQFEEAFSYGADTAFDWIKGASFDSISDLDRELGISIAVKNATFGPSVKLVASAEFAELCPGIFKIASMLPEPIQDALIGVTQVCGVLGRQAAFQELADVIVEEPVNEKIASSLLENLSAMEDPAESLNNAGDTEESQDSAGSIRNVRQLLQSRRQDNRVPIIARGPNATDFRETNKDMIDSILAGGDEPSQSSTPAPGLEATGSPQPSRAPGDSATLQ